MGLEQQREVVLEWHRMARPIIGTQDFAISWNDFRNAWKKVKHPHGEVMQNVLNSIDNDATLPASISRLGYGPLGQSLVLLCIALQNHHGKSPFFLSSRTASAYLGNHFTDAAKILSSMVEDQVLELVSKGAGFKASRYLFIRKE